MTAVIIPWQSGCFYRQANLEFICALWEHIGFEPTLGVLPQGEPWCKAKAVDAVIDCVDDDVLIIADADVWCGYPYGLSSVENGEVPWVQPHDEIRRLSPTSTSDALLLGDMLLTMNGEYQFDGILDEPASKSILGGGLTVVRREVYDDVPMDARFVGWGHEDEAWTVALRKLHPGGTHARERPLWHMWHPPQARQKRSRGSKESLERRNAYLRAQRSEERLRELVDEGRVRSRA